MYLNDHLGREMRPRIWSLTAFALVAVLTAAVTSLSVPTQSMAGVARRAPVLGAHTHLAPFGSGWGVAHPHRINNGGDPSGLVFSINWHHWGAKHAFGNGKTPLFKPGGGFYKRPGRIILRAQRLGRCPHHTRHAYTRLVFRIARKPGGAVGQRWHRWGPSQGNICRRNA